MEGINTLGTIALDLNKVNCRICLRYCKMINSLDKLAMCEDRVLLKDLLKQVTGIELSTHGDKIPNSICQECTNKLLNSNDFIRRVERAEQILVDLMYAEDIKDEKVQFEDNLTSEDHMNWNTRNTLINQSVVSDECIDTPGTANLKFMQNTSHNFNNTKYNDVVDKNDNYDNDDCSLHYFKGDSVCDEYNSSDDDTTQLQSFTVETSKKDREDLVGSRLNIFQTSGWFTCKECSRQFAKETTLNRHMNTVHTILPSEQAQVAGGKSLNCPYCPHQFVRKHSLRRHLLHCHPEQPQIEADDNTNIKNSVNNKMPSGYKRCLCPHCGKSYSQASLTIHIRRHTGEAPYKCSQCDKAYPRRQDLTVHERQHTGEKPHRCIICGKSFITPNKLTRHLRVHTGVRPYKCDQCAKAFAQSNDLKIHLRRHTGEKPYKCNVCAESFISGSILNKHRIKTQHIMQGEKVDRYAKCRLSCQNLPQSTVINVENHYDEVTEANISSDNSNI